MADNHPKALITGIGGQDGSYLAEFLLERGYEVIGFVRDADSPFEHLTEIRNHIRFIKGDLTLTASIERAIKEVTPDEVYNLGGQSSSRDSWNQSEYTMLANGMSVVSFLEAIRQYSPRTKFFQAGSAELFGNITGKPLSETSPFHPKNPYGVAKLCAHYQCVNMRDKYGIFASNGLLFNHESPRRKIAFVTRKIAHGLVAVKSGAISELRLGTLDTRRDWGYAPDYVRAMWTMLQADSPDDYVIATGESHSVREFVEVAGQELGMALRWEGAGVEEVGIDDATGRVIVRIDSQFFNPNEANFEVGDPSKITSKLGWKPEKKFDDLVRIMVKAELQKIATT